jgi:hypothetical protein
MPDISRGLSEATPPEHHRIHNSTPEECQKRDNPMGDHESNTRFCHPSGVNCHYPVDRGYRFAHPPANICQPSRLSSVFPIGFSNRVQSRKEAGVLPVFP